MLVWADRGERGTIIARYGYSRGMELSPGLWLSFYDCEYHQDLMVRAPGHDHLIQIVAHLSGFIYFDAVHPNLGGTSV